MVKRKPFLVSLLRVNPVIGMKDGEVHPYARKRSRAKAIDHLYNFAASFGNVEGLAVEYATDFDEANRAPFEVSSSNLFTSRVEALLLARIQDLVSSLLACLETGKPASSAEKTRCYLIAASL